MEQIGFMSAVSVDDIPLVGPVVIVVVTDAVVTYVVQQVV
jgi:hypothetical protein